MSSVLVLDVGATRLRTSLVECGDMPTLIDTGDCAVPTAPDDLDPLLAVRVERVVHRFIHTPPGVPEASDQIELEAVAAAGEVEPDDTIARLAVWRHARTLWPDRRHTAVFDTAWFADLPAVARCYALPLDLAVAYPRRGRHGPVHRRAAATAAAERVVSVYLDRESSVAAVRDGRPVEVSAGATALEGVPGGGTVGDVDPAALLYLVEHAGVTVPELERLLRTESGLAGWSGSDSAVACRHADDPAGLAALSFIAHRVRRYVGAYAAVLGGIDALVISHAPCFADPPLFRDIAGGLEYLGVGSRAPVIIAADDLATACAAAALEGAP